MWAKDSSDVRRRGCVFHQEGLGSSGQKAEGALQGCHAEEFEDYSLGFETPKPDVNSRMEQEEEPCIPDWQDARERVIPREAGTGARQDPLWVDTSWKYFLWQCPWILGHLEIL